MNELVKRLHELNVVKRGDFSLSSGGKTDYYIDLRKAYGDPNARRMIKERLWNLMPEGITCIAGQGYGGITPASIIAEEHGLYLTLVRDARKDYGMTNIIEGYMPIVDDRVVIVDDLLTTGGTLRRVIENIQPTGAQILGCYVVIKRGEAELNYPVKWLLTAEQLL